MKKTVYTIERSKYSFTKVTKELDNGEKFSLHFMEDAGDIELVTALEVEIIKYRKGVKK